MDSASKNASDMIGSLQMQYNRGRQAAITNELVDIITGWSFRVLHPRTHSYTASPQVRVLFDLYHSTLSSLVGVLRWNIDHYTAIQHLLYKWLEQVNVSAPLLQGKATASIMIL